MDNMPWILLADDDPEDRDLLKSAFQIAGFNRIEWVCDGVDLDDYLHGRNQRSAPKPFLPALILMDLNMPRVDGLEATAKLKAHPWFRQIPVVLLTTSNATDDVTRAYAAGANAYIAKPSEFGGLLKIATALRHYWFEIVTLPSARPALPN
jgi:two-component system response regulator